jgi:chitodextrinase
MICCAVRPCCAVAMRQVLRRTGLFSVRPCWRWPAYRAPRRRPPVRPPPAAVRPQRRHLHHAELDAARQRQRPTYFRVYENGAVVARNTTIHATIGNLVFNSTHTYTVTAVDPYGRESAPSAPVTRTAIVGGPFACGLTAPSGLVATDLTASAMSLSWSNAQPCWDQSGTLLVLLDGVAVQQTTLDSVRISGLAPTSTHTVQVARRDCNSTLHPSASLTVTTLPGGSVRPAAPTGLTVGARNNTSIALSWAPSAGAAVRYQVYDGATPVAASAPPVRRSPGCGGTPATSSPCPRWTRRAASRRRAHPRRPPPSPAIRRYPRRPS